MDTNGSQDNGMGGTAHTQGDQHNNDSGRGSSGGGSNSHSNTYANPMAPQIETQPAVNEMRNGHLAEESISHYQATHNSYGDALTDQGTIDSNIAAKEASNRADQAWNAGDYGAWAQESLSALGSGFMGGIGTTISDVTTHPLDSFADLMRSPLGTIGALALGPIGMMTYGAVVGLDDVTDAMQGEKTTEEAISQGFLDASPLAGGLLGSGLAAIGYGMQGNDAAAAGSIAGGVVNAALPGLGGLADKGVQSLIGDHVGTRVGAAFGEGLANYGRGSNGHGSLSTSGTIQTDASNPAGIGDVAAQAQNNLHRQAQLGTNTQGTTLSNNLGALSGANTQPVQFGANNQALTQAQIDQQRTGVRMGGVNGGDTGIMLGGGSGATGIQTANRTVANEAASHGYAVNNNPDLVDTSGYTYVNQNGILNV